MAGLLHMRIPTLVTGLLGAALALPVAVATSSHASPTLSDVPAGHISRATTVKPRSDGWEATVLKLTNARRQAHGRKPLTAAACPDGFAEPWTRHMAKLQVLKHQDIRPMLGCPHTSFAGENIAFGFETPRALVSAWMHSAGHRANILSRHFHRIGISGWRATNGQTYATQDFVG
jgi:uncharacterized protein YkwD